MRNPGRPVYDLYEKNQDFLVAQEQKLGAKGHWALLEYSPVISPQFATLLFFSFVFHSTVRYLSSLLISLPFSSFLLSFILLFYVLSPARLPCRGNLTPVSNVCEAGPKSLFWASNGRNKLPEMRFKFPFNLIGKSTMAFLKGQSWHVLKSWYTGGDPEQGFRRCFTDDLNQSLVSSVAQATVFLSLSLLFALLPSASLLSLSIFFFLHIPPSLVIIFFTTSSRSTSFLPLPTSSVSSLFSG